MRAQERLTEMHRGDSDDGRDGRVEKKESGGTGEHLDQLRETRRRSG